ncbi:rhodanese-like domain-containing protein [Marinobacterium sp. D7]|uniref:rhodanese-like domain-containing protein n=1 Tax=Marinobacterium ramblicola TaxID=2849041 RepID=UPI001C2D1D08|nr:rhodanese-like domain-containing protein [Marinobacterium ramblicola]MBV1789480.1 rhodanese-like domain-containing protein [Marinobacterium ramblicola]
MTKQLIALITLLPALLLSLVAQAGPREDTGWEKIANGALLVDVRTEQEYAGGHLDGALLIPYQQIVEQFAARDIPKDQPVVLYCRSGNRAGIAERALRESGYTQLFNAGGFTAMAESKPANLTISDKTACTPKTGESDC